MRTRSLPCSRTSSNRPGSATATLTAPAADEIVGGPQVEIGEPGDAVGAQPGTQGPPADRGRGDGEHGGVEHGGVERSAASCAFLPGELRVVVRGRRPGEQVARGGVEGLTVVAQLCGGPGERLGDAAAEHLLQQRQHLAGGGGRG